MREFKLWWLNRQQEREKAIGFNEQNNDSAYAFYILVFFFTMLCKTATSNDQF